MTPQEFSPADAETPEPAADDRPSADVRDEPDADVEPGVNLADTPFPADMKGDQTFGDEFDLEPDGAEAPAADGVILWNPNAPGPPPNGEFERIDLFADGTPCHPLLDLDVSVGPQARSGNRRLVIVQRRGQGEVLRDRCDLTEMKVREKLSKKIARAVGLDADEEVLACIELTLNEAYDAADEMQSDGLAEAGAADRLHKLVKPQLVEAFADRGGREYVIVERPLAGGPARDHNDEDAPTVRECMPILGSRFAKFLRKVALDAKMKVQSGAVLAELQQTLAAEAEFGGNVKDVFRRVGWHETENGRGIVLDLCREDGKVVVVTRDGWNVVDESPVPFLRTPSMEELPLPKRGGDLGRLRPLVNLRDEDYPLFLALLLMTLRPSGPYPVAAIYGENGCAKTSLGVILSRVIDPQKLDEGKWEEQLMTLDTVKNFVLAASEGHVLGFDNVGELNSAFSDAICRGATGASLKTRKLYTTDEMVRVRYQCLIILTSVTEVVTAPDLLSRCVILRPPKIEGEGDRGTALDIQREFEKAWPDVLGGLLDAAAFALKAEADGEADGFPLGRMADFERFVTAGEPALGLERGTVIKRLREVSLDAEVATLDGFPAVTALVDVLQDGAKNLSLRPPGEPDTLRGTATELLDPTKSHAEVRGNPANWPSNGQSFSVQLDTCKGTLRKLGVEFEKLSRGRQRQMQVKLLDGPGVVRDRPVGQPGPTLIREKEDRQAMLSKAKQSRKERAAGKSCSATRPTRVSVLGEDTAPDFGDAVPAMPSEHASIASHATRSDDFGAGIHDAGV